MSFLRPEAVAVLTRWKEVGAAVAAIGFGLWLLALGGYFFVPLGAAVLVLATGWLVIALRRLRFQRPVGAPGVVEVDEGQVGYLGPNFGGYLALRELAELRMIRLQGQRHWRLRQADGQVLIIPTNAAGAEQLFDAFATLPGADMSVIAAALDGHADTQLLWTCPPKVALT
ncbi:MAG: hypothetical protein WBH04_05715 [Albidovulum sp.]